MLHHMNMAAMTLADGRTAVGSRGRMLIGRVDLLRLFGSNNVTNSIFAGHQIESQEVKRKYDCQNFHGPKIAFLIRMEKEIINPMMNFNHTHTVGIVE